VNPHDLLALKGPEATGQFIARELHDTYINGGAGLRKVHADVQLVR